MVYSVDPYVQRARGSERARAKGESERESGMESETQLEKERGEDGKRVSRREKRGCGTRSQLA